MRKQRVQTHWFNLLMICAAGGVILSVLVAWWCAYNEGSNLIVRVFPMEDPTSFPPNDARSGIHHGLQHYYSPPKRSQGWFYWELHDGSEVKIISHAFELDALLPSELDFIEPLPVEDGPSWSIVRTPPTVEQIQSGSDLLEEARGWPMPCAGSIIGSNNLTSWYIVWGIQFGTNSAYPVPRVLPIKPIWFGLFVDTVFYGIIVLVLMRIVVSIRSVIRAKRGLCRGCGYTMQTLKQCPECGTSATKR